MARHYLDHAATGWPKSPDVLDAVQRFLRDGGAAGGRGLYASGLESNRWLDRARVALGRLIGSKRYDQIAFVGSGTDALNHAILGSLQTGDHVVTTAAEHNSVLRPVAELARRGEITWEIVPCDSTGLIDLQRFQTAVANPATRFVATTHVSNVTGAIQDLEQIGSIVRGANILWLVDAAQSLGYLPVDVSSFGIDWLAAPGHKGLGAILGTGMLYASERAVQRYRPIRFGGSGTLSEQLIADLPWQQSIEVGNLNLPGIVSMAIAAEDLLKLSSEQLRARTEAVSKQLFQCFRTRRALRVIGSLDPMRQTPIVSVESPSFSPSELAVILDQHYQIECRAGLHCAALIHDCLGLARGEGTLRVSASHTNSAEDFARIAEAVEALDS